MMQELIERIVANTGEEDHECSRMSLHALTPSGGCITSGPITTMKVSSAAHQPAADAKLADVARAT